MVLDSITELSPAEAADFSVSLQIKTIPVTARSKAYVLNFSFFP
jgi:hypothetical protein